MLPYENRLRRPAEFRSVMASGRRARRGCLVVHFQPELSASVVPVAGLVVGRSVGSSVVRHRVSRRLRAQLATRLVRLPSGSAVVVRALPGAGAADSATLSHDLDAALERVL